LVEAVEVRTEDTIYLVKVSTKLANRLEKFEDEDLEDIVVPIDAIKGIDGEIGDEEEEEEETDLSKDPAGSADDDEDEDEDENDPIDEEDEEE
jgi:hypothetical protein